MSKARKYWGVPGAFLAGAVILSGMTPLAASSQEMDTRWLPWLGCWAPVASEGAEVDPSSLLCVRPAGAQDAVELLSVVDGAIESVDILSANGERRETALEGCEGWQSGSFSADAGRVYLRTDEVCEGGQRRASTSLMSWTSTYEWSDIEIVEVGGRSVAWVRRYEVARSADVEAAGLGDIIRGRALAVATARTAASAPISVDDIIEANARVGALAVQTWVAESGQPPRLDADKLVRMADAGVPAEVIDVLIALGNPDRFALGPAGEQGEYAASEQTYSRAYGPRYAYGRSYYSAYLDPFYYSRFGIGFSPYGYGYGRSYSPFGYGYGFGRFGGFGGFSPIIRVEPISNSRRSRGGRAVNGRGYTRSGGGNSGRAARSHGSNRGSSSASARSGRSSGGSKGPVRTAKPRGGGRRDL
ncbi:MAG: hypothetical protein BMS9Abin29_2179 [Gemmatimonadota bacterium]|nr:MAG: hypothetical protein BMS9Abin29_2179 [Gemmatimonadota bacterium]